MIGSSILGTSMFKCSIQGMFVAVNGLIKSTYNNICIHVWEGVEAIDGIEVCSRGEVVSLRYLSSRQRNGNDETYSP